MATEINLPNEWRPRSYQRELWTALESGIDRFCCIWHRRSGKDLTALNWIACASQQRIGTYWHVGPTFKQSRQIIWNGIRGDGTRFLDAFPGWRNPHPDGFVTRIRDDEMTIWLQNGSVVQMIGSEDVDRLVGPNPVGIILTEYAIQDPRFWEYVRPILMENGGFMGAIYTPRGRNHGYKLYQRAKENPRWFCQLLTIDDTARMSREALEPVPLTPEQVEQEILDGMSPEVADQEFYCSWDAALEGAYFGELMKQARKEKRIGSIVWDPELPVVTAWDLGMGDANAIIFAQPVGNTVRIIDYVEGSGKGIDHWCKLVLEKPYTYKEHIGPHDLKVRDPSASGGRARYEIAKDLGVRFRIVRKLSFEDGIQASRALIPRTYFNEDPGKAERLVQALNEYTKKKLPSGEFADYPVRDWTNHPADAYRYLATGLRPEIKKSIGRKLQPEVAVV